MTQIPTIPEGEELDPYSQLAASLWFLTAAQIERVAEFAAHMAADSLQTQLGKRESDLWKTS
jgi:hypothetical protein